ncbi:type II toxin-antitoxin system RelB/DinJ family antitoxin [Enterococcus faecalis]|uniref:type II toxin-antitoxin system RelB/DinJ family antitoxin n=1 Tax=Enterococcus TaxID=1350 RepID=UPI000F80721D|nr:MULTISPECIES: type II toxin-antitoxin system RelB/DinJ family antitoxin [Enterococcus]EGO2792989.1 type II toxin-antitoxin system RelB/DinJ family antitoxin [Enterococcus faecalis]EGO5162777.1 type II toxin-antitoxin system RelB/DinJ family antitoxin [Enterococcus faecalis]EGO8242171.1 type II toxin-antitoxin system RelB/DinJ family antitoxin [Enterococcus faecalis]EGO8813512.1 type II toxin-antitoxin system RelB/DinJ family antitoxin [Enterococcus faecalis]EHD7928578.1 type II toxin-antito
MANINIRVDEEIKEQSKDVFEALGMDLSTGIKIYLKQVIAQNAIPFDLATNNLEIALNEKRRGLGVRFDNAESLIEDLGLDD